MFLREITKRQELNFFVTENFGGNFLQSFEWGEFQKSLGRSIWRIGVYKNVIASEAKQSQDNNLTPLSPSLSGGGENDDELLAVATVIEHPLGLGLSYLYCPYGLVYRDDLSFIEKEECTRFIMTELRKITVETKNQEEIFVRIEPRLDLTEVGNFFTNEGFKKAHAMQPQDTQVVNLDESEAWILKQMHSKTRYNIRLAERKKIIIQEAKDSVDLENFWQLMQITTKRDNFHTHEKRYYEKLWNSFRESDLPDQMHLTIKILIARYKEKPIATVMLGFFGGRVIYLHGASDHEYRHLMAPHLLQWQGMKLGMENGYKLYDFNGIKPDQRTISKKDKENKWEGVTRFKKSFGGKEVNYVGAWDWVYDNTKYKVYKLAHKILVR